MEDINPWRANHPGRILLSYLTAKNWSQKYFADLIGKSPIEINYIIKGTKNINTDFAIRFGLAFSTSAEVWLNLQAKYDLYKARNGNKKNEYILLENKILPLLHDNPNGNSTSRS